MFHTIVSLANWTKEMVADRISRLCAIMAVNRIDAYPLQQPASVCERIAL
jgi:hypothetical protein